jgi:hypothetical protein
MVAQCIKFLEDRHSDVMQVKRFSSSGGRGGAGGVSGSGGGSGSGDRISITAFDE